MKIINLTSKELCFIGKKYISIPPENFPAKNNIKVEEEIPINGIPVKKETLNYIENLPAPEKGTIYIVSKDVGKYCIGRRDVFVPSDPIRGAEDGKIVCFRSLCRV